MNPTRTFLRGLAPAAAALAVAIAAAPALAQSKAGTTIGQFLLIEPSARITAMGNAGVSLLGGLDAAYYNPAAVSTIERYEVVFSHSEWLADIRYDYAGIAIPMGRFGIAYGTVTSLGSGEIDVRTVAQPLGTGERYTVNDIAFGLGYGRAITDRFSVGGQVSYMQETIWHSTVSAMGLNIGTMFKVAEHGLHIGSSLSNFGTQASYDGRDLRILYDNDPARYGDNGALPGLRFTDPFALPVMLRVGLGWPVRIDPANSLQLAVDAFHRSDNSESVSMGAEWAYREVVALRAGYQNLFLEDSEMGLTLGAGVGGKLDVYGYRLDYAWADHGRLGSTQRFSFDIEF